MSKRSTRVVGDDDSDDVTRCFGKQEGSSSWFGGGVEMPVEVGLDPQGPWDRGLWRDGTALR
jgi:hypothetical protein